MTRTILVWLVRYLPFVLSVGAVYGVWAAFKDRQVRPADNLDTRILVAMGAAYALAAGVMLVFNREWSLRALGQFWTYTANAAFWGAFGAGRMGWRHHPTQGELVLLRSPFVVGAALLIVGLGVYLLGRFARWWAWWPKSAIVAWTANRRIIRTYRHL